MTSTQTGEPDPPDAGGDQAGIAAAQGDTVVMAAPVNGTSPEGQAAQPAEPVQRATPRLRRAWWSRSPRAGRPRRSSRWLIATGGVVLTALGVSLWFAISSVGGKAPAGLTDPAEGAAAFVPYRDPQGRFSLSHPPGWQQEPSSASQAALLLRTDEASQNSMLVRIVPLDEPVRREQLGEAKKLTDSLVQASDVNVVVVRQITLNGVPGYYYLYTFGEPGSDRFGLHAHYFLFSGSTMHVLVFQALPDTEFVDLAPDFDAIARSYRVR